MLKTCNVSLKLKKNGRDLEEEHKSCKGKVGSLLWPKMGESSPISAKCPFYRWLARPRSGAECAPASMQCSAAELDFRRQKLDFPNSCFRGPNVPPKRMHVRRPNLTFGGRTWVFLQRLFMQNPFNSHLISFKMHENISIKHGSTLLEVSDIRDSTGR